MQLVQGQKTVRQLHIQLVQVELLQKKLPNGPLEHELSMTSIRGRREGCVCGSVGLGVWKSGAYGDLFVSLRGAKRSA